LSGVHNTKISSIEHGRLSPSEREIKQWAIACGVPEQVPELIAAHRVAALMWQEYSQRFRLGLKHIHSDNELYERTKLLRVYESTRIPGILQEPSYVRAVMEWTAEHFDLQQDQDEIDGAIAGRLSKRQVLARARFSFVLEAAALDLMVGGADIMHQQLDFLLTVTRMRNVAFGIVPPAVPRAMWAGEGFYLFDGAVVWSALWTGRYVATNPDDVAPYIKIFERLRQAAVYGRAARALIETARSKLPS
jgi:Domain of unknown function (DUF5753)